MRTPTQTCLFAALLTLAFGCEALISGPRPTNDGGQGTDGSAGNSGEIGGSDPDPTPHDDGTRPPVVSTSPSTRSHNRLTADQLARSVEVATGQPWTRYSQYAELIGEPDFFESVAHDRTISMSFVKLLEDGALDACGKAIKADQDQANPGRRTIMRYADDSNVASADVTTNINYLLERFHGIDVVSAQDSRLTSLSSILTAPLSNTEERNAPNAYRNRWKAVCVALITHPDFFTY